MSLINKMLQDLDSRGTPAGAALDAQVQSVGRERDARGARTIALAVAGVVALGAAGWIGWTHYQAALALARPVPARAAAATPAQAAKVAALAAAIAPAARAPVSGQAPAPAASAPADAGAKTVAPMEPDSDEARATRRALAQLLASRAPVALPYDAHAHAETEAHLPAREKRVARAEVPPPHAVGHVARPVVAAAPDASAAAPVRQAGGAQRAENAYRRALASMQEGRMGETVDALEQALKDDPNHEAARQTLVGLLVEAKRTDEAMRQLQLGLTLDPRQPAMAMLLARLQIEAGGNGIDTLMRTLPYAGNDADYHGFLAGALARQQRNREAAEQYQLAVRAAPDKGVWWMGLGLSLQADKRDAEALDAFQKARAGAGLSPDLQAFVERRIQQLGH